MQLPSPIATYFDADQRHDGDALAAAFSGDAVVSDEGAEHAGPAAIRAWWRASKAKYRQVAEPLDLAEADGKIIVRARVSGNFPGSPATLTFAFTLVGARIASLEIR
jgi:ketosteroid isomerase-like protein